MGRLGFVPMSDQPFLLEDDTGEILLEDGTWLLLETVSDDPTRHEGGHAVIVGAVTTVVVRGTRT